MKLKEGVVLTDVSGKRVLVDAGASGECFQGIIKLNESAALIAEKLKENVTIDTLAAALVDEYEIDLETAKNDVQAFVNQLKETGMLED